MDYQSVQEDGIFQTTSMWTSTAQIWPQFMHKKTESRIWGFPMERYFPLEILTLTFSKNETKLST